MIININMNRFATIVPAIRFRKVTYYSIQMEDSDSSLFLEFVNNHTADEYAEPLSLIRSWIRKIGNEIGAHEQYFRFEGFRGGDARAFPPPSKYLDIDCDLRLYCMRINQDIVILFSGAKKTAPTAQECDFVRPHFLLANKLTPVIDQALRDGDIKIDEDEGKLIFNEDLTLAL